MGLSFSIPRLCIGSWQLSGPSMINDGQPNGFPDYLGELGTVELIHSLKTRGLNFIDTALNYGNGLGMERISKACREDRSAWILSSKFGERILNTGQVVMDLSAAQAAETLDITLEKLRTDYLDIYLCHYAPETDEQCEEIAAFFNVVKQTGRVKAIGVSSNNLEKLRLLHEKIQLQTAGQAGLDIVQFDCNLLEPHFALQDFLSENQIQGVARGILARGKLTGKYFKNLPDYSEKHIMAGKASSRFFTEYAVFQNVMASRGALITAYRYVLDFPAVSSVIVGGKNLSDYAVAFEALQALPLTPNELEEIKTAREQLKKRESELSKDYQHPISLLSAW